MPEETKVLLRQLDADVVALTRRVRVRFFITVAAFSAVVIAGAGTTYAVHENNVKIDEMACFIISETPDDSAHPIIHRFRHKYHCPPFKAHR